MFDRRGCKAPFATVSGARQKRTGRLQFSGNLNSPTFSAADLRRQLLLIAPQRAAPMPRVRDLPL
jgi:hypothetical protein